MKYYADQLHIENFRKIKDVNIILGRKITVFSGQNGVGKSNLLSLIATTFGLQKRRINSGNFQPEFNDFFTIPQDENYKDYRTHIKVVDSESKDSFIQKRHAYKNDTKGNRGIRIIPRISNYFTPHKTITTLKKEVQNNFNIGADGRVPVPTIFLSLARLYPVGETQLTGTSIRSNNKLHQTQAINNYIKWYNFVLPNSISHNESNAKFVTKNINDSDALFVNLDKGNESTQSVGQDNLGSIISALTDFYVLKNDNDFNYVGGILCIDEIDSSLHPSAQLRLFNLLTELTKDLNLQIFITTHSLTILKEIIKNRNKNKEDFQLAYFKDPYEPRQSRITNYNELKADLFDEVSNVRPSVKIYCEDEMTKFILDELSKVFKKEFPEKFTKLPTLEIIPVFLGCAQLKELPNQDSHFKKVLILLDGEAKTNSKYLLKEYIKKESLKHISDIDLPYNVLTLPTYLAPESYLYYIINQIFYNNDDFGLFWRNLENIEEARLYTKSRILTNILNKIDSSTVEKNDTIKRNVNEADLKDFISKSQILSEFYSNDNHRADLKKFFDKYYEVIMNIYKQLRADNY